jgi:hypothetical protein
MTADKKKTSKQLLRDFLESAGLLAEEVYVPSFDDHWKKRGIATITRVAGYEGTDWHLDFCFDEDGGFVSIYTPADVV